MFDFSAPLCDVLLLENGERRRVCSWLWTWWNGQLEISSALLLMIWQWLNIVVSDRYAVITVVYIVTSVTLNLWQMFTLCYASVTVI